MTGSGRFLQSIPAPNCDLFFCRIDITATVDRTLAKETRAALDVMSQDNVIIPERPGKTGLSRAKDSHGGDSKQSSQMHRASVVRQQQTALAQFIDELIERSLTDSVHAA